VKGARIWRDALAADVHDATSNLELTARMFYLRRLFIYHDEVETGSKQSEASVVMECTC
jgi:hypothetical protein